MNSVAHSTEGSASEPVLYMALALNDTTRAQLLCDNVLPESSLVGGV